jgi:hypothetical protein
MLGLIQIEVNFCGWHLLAGQKCASNQQPRKCCQLVFVYLVPNMFRLGSWVETGDILVGKLTPQIASELSYTPSVPALKA